MTIVSLIVAALATAQYQYSPPAAPPPSAMPPASSSQNAGQRDVEAVVVQVYDKCFQAAEAETRAAGTDVKQLKFDACRNQHARIVKHVTAKLKGSQARQVQRALHRALTDVETRYAKQMGVVLSATAD